MAIDGGVLDAPADRGAAAELGTDTDAWLIRGVIDGSQDALAALYDRYDHAVFAAAVRTSRDPATAAEVVQETFLALWNRAELYDPTRGSLASWLLTIARNRSIDHLRVAKRRDRAASFSSFGAFGEDDHSLAEWLTSSGELVAAAGEEPVPDAALSSKETRASLDNAIASLAPVERSVILLAYDSGLSQAEIAVRLGWPLGTVKTRTRRALRHLRDHLARTLDAGPAPVAGGPSERPVRERPARPSRPVATASPCH